MTAWSLEPMDVNKCWVASLEMLCQALTAAASGCYLFMGPSALRFVFSKWKICALGRNSGDWLSYWRTFQFFALNSLVTNFPYCTDIYIHSYRFHHQVYFGTKYCHYKVFFFTLIWSVIFLDYPYSLQLSWFSNLVLNQSSSRYYRLYLHHSWQFTQ